MKYRKLARFLCIAVCICCTAVFTAPMEADAYSYYTKAKPTLTVKISDTGSYSYLTWSRVKGATGYKVYRSDNGGKYRLIKTTSKRSLKNTKLRTEYPYKYKVKAYRKTVKYVKVKGKKKKQKRTYISYSKYSGAKSAKVRSSFRDRTPALSCTADENSIGTFTVTKSLSGASGMQLAAEDPSGRWNTAATLSGVFSFRYAVEDGCRYRLREYRKYTYGRYSYTVYSRWSSPVTAEVPEKSLESDVGTVTVEGVTFSLNGGEATSTMYVNEMTGSRYIRIMTDREIDTSDLEYYINEGKIEVEGCTAMVNKEGVLMGETQDGDGKHDMPGYTEVCAAVPSWKEIKAQVYYGCDPFSIAKHKIAIYWYDKCSIPVRITYKGRTVYDGVFVNDSYTKEDIWRTMTTALENECWYTEEGGERSWNSGMTDRDRLVAIINAFYDRYEYGPGYTCATGACVLYYAAKDLGLHPRNVFPCRENYFLHEDFYCYGYQSQTAIGGHVEISVDTDGDGIEERYGTQGH